MTQTTMQQQDAQQATKKRKLNDGTVEPHFQQVAMFRALSIDDMNHILDYYTFPLQRYLKHVFFYDQLGSMTAPAALQQPHLVQQNSTNPNAISASPSAALQPTIASLYASHNPILKKQTIEQQSRLFKLLFGYFTTEQQRQKNRGSPKPIWRNVDMSIKSSYFQDHEPLSSQQLLMICQYVRNCRHINFFGNHHFGDACLEVLLKQNAKLESIDLRVTKVDFSGIEYMMEHPAASQIKSIKLTWLSRTQMTDNSLYLFGYQTVSVPQLPPPIPVSAQQPSQPQPPTLESKTGNAKSLIRLELINNNIHSQGVKLLTASNPSFQVLNLSHNQLKDDGANILSQNCPNLRELYLEDCDITDAGAQLLFKMKLKKLDLSRNQNITDQAIENLPSGSITYLQLTDTSITDRACLLLSKNTSLLYLLLDHTKIGNEGVKNLLLKDWDKPEIAADESKVERNMPQLQVLNIRQTKVTKLLFGELKKYQQQLKQLQVFTDAV